MDVKLNDKAVYLAAPKRLLSSDLYDRAFRFMLARCKGVMNPQWMFKDNKDWSANYEKALSVCDVMVIVSDDNFVGRGVYLEYEHFKLRKCDVLCYVEDEEMIDEEIDYHSKLIPVARLQIEDDENWIDYATVLHR